MCHCSDHRITLPLPAPNQSKLALIASRAALSSFSDMAASEASLPEIRVFITGAAGFSGRWLVKAMVEHNDAVLAGHVPAHVLAHARVSSDSYVYKEPWDDDVSDSARLGAACLPPAALLAASRHLYRVYAGDLPTAHASPFACDAEWPSFTSPYVHRVMCDIAAPAEHAHSIHRAMHTSRATECVHMAALVPFNLSRAYGASDLMRVNVEGTRHVVEACLASGVTSLIYASSTGVVFTRAHVHNEDVDERVTVPPQALNDAYSTSKATAEALVLSHSTLEACACVCIRPNGVWGPGGEAHHMPKLFRMLSVSAPFAAISFGCDTLTDFTHAANLAHAYLLALQALRSERTRKRVAGQAYFVTDGYAAHTLEFMAPLTAACGYTPAFPCVYVPRGVCGLSTDTRVDAATFQRVKAHAGSITDAGEDEIIVTGPAWLPFPEPVMYVIAATSIIGASLCSLLLGVSCEPFLTFGDVRKVVRHNYYSSRRAARALGYAPLRSQAQAMKETAAWYRARGYTREVHTVPMIMQVLVTLGFAAMAVLSFTPMCALVTSHACAADLAPRCASLSAAGVRVIFLAASLCHVIQGLVAAVYAHSHNMCALMWGLNSTAWGFGSTAPLLSKCAMMDARAQERVTMLQPQSVAETQARARMETRVMLGNLCLFLLCVPVSLAFMYAIGDMRW